MKKLFLTLLKLTVAVSLFVTVVSLIGLYAKQGGALWMMIGFIVLLVSSLILVIAKVFLSSPKENGSFIKYD